MEEIIYRASNESIKTAVIKAGVLGVFAGLVLMGMQYREGLRSAGGLLVAFVLMAVMFGLAVFFSDSSIRNYEICVNATGLSRMSYKGMFNYELQWRNIDLIVIGEVMERYQRWDSWFQGMEIHNHSDTDYTYKTIYKLEHIDNNEALIEGIKRCCDQHGVKYNDIRKTQHTG